jgi:hypothetical protein
MPTHADMKTPTNTDILDGCISIDSSLRGGEVIFSRAGVQVVVKGANQIPAGRVKHLGGGFILVWRVFGGFATNCSPAEQINTSHQETPSR